MPADSRPGQLDCRFSSSARTTFSGMIGKLKTRAPMAAATALAGRV